MGKDAVLHFTDIPKRFLVTKPEILYVTSSLGGKNKVAIASFPKRN